MARFYLDNDAPVPVAVILNELGHQSTTALQEQTRRLRDNEHLLFAARSAMILITHNRRDFVELHHAWLNWTGAWSVDEMHPGVIVLPQDAGWSHRQMAEEIVSIVVEKHSLLNRIFHWFPRSGWIEE